MNSVIVEQSLGLKGTVHIAGAKNAVLVEIASLILTTGTSILHNVPFSEDVFHMCKLLEDLGARIEIDQLSNQLIVDTSNLTQFKVLPERMKKMRASILVLGPLLARSLKAEVAVPGGCVLGARPIDYHLKNFAKMGVDFEFKGEYLCAKTDKLQAKKIVLEYPSVGATENILMAATLTAGCTEIINAALEPEVLDLIELLTKMGAQISVSAPATITVVGVQSLQPVEHAVITDRLEAGTFLIAAAITGGSVYIPNARQDYLDVFLLKLEEMGHFINTSRPGIELIAGLSNNKAVSFKTSPYPGFPTDLQAPMSALLSISNGTGLIEETVFENRLLHCFELNKMGASIKVEGVTASVTGVTGLHGAEVVGTDIRGACALVLAGLAAKGTTTVTGLHHLKRGYEQLDIKLRSLGAKIYYQDEVENSQKNSQKNRIMQ